MQQVVVKRPIRQEDPYDHNSGMLPIFLLSAFCTLAATAGINRLTGLAFLVSLLLAGLLHLVKISLLPWYESGMGGGNRTASYLGIALITVPLTAFGLYGIIGLTGEDSRQLPKSESQPLRLVEPALAAPTMERPIEEEYQLHDELLNYDENSNREVTTFRQQQRWSQTPAIRNQSRFEPREDAMLSNVNQLAGMNRLADESSGSDGATGGFQHFVGEALARETMALSCWLVPLFIEAVIFAIVLFNRPRVYYDYYRTA